jgi:type IV secretory pathway TraG/TraD family ATPase VirD4
MKNKSQGTGGVDLVTPIVEIVHEVITMILRAVFEIGKYGFKAYFKSYEGIQKIERSRLLTKKTTSNPEALGIDAASKKEVLLDEIDFSKHSFIVGASGFGKTNLITNIQEHYLKNDRPLIFFDPKGDLEALTNFKNLCERYKKKCHVFSESYGESVQLNPVLEGTISQVVDRIIDAFEWTEPYYMEMSTRALRSTLEQLEKDDTIFSLKNIYEHLVNNHDSKETVGLIVKLENIVKSDFGKYLGQDNNDYTLKKIREEGSCLYIGLSTQGYGKTAKGLGKIFLGELLYNSYKKLNSSPKSSVNKENPIGVIFDEFGALVTEGFIELENKCRGAGIDLTMAIQTIADIDKISPELTVQVMENAANLFILKQRVATSASLLAESIGTIITKKQTNMTENGEKGERGTEREVHELAVHADVIKNLRVGQCILLRQHPHKVNLINIRNSEHVEKNSEGKVNRNNKEALFV